MSAKRHATKELNNDNWDQEDEHEEAGVFRCASEEELKKRVIKKARRTIKESDKSNNDPKSVFSSFSGFGNLTSMENNKKTPFSFLSKMTENSTVSGKNSEKTTIGLGAKTPNFVFNNVEKKNNLDAKCENLNKALYHEENQNSKSSEFCRQLVSLNHAFCDWIKTCIDKNPVCFLTPVFKNYENYLEKLESEEKEIDKCAKPSIVEPCTTLVVTTSIATITPSFSFGSTPLGSNNTSTTSIFAQETSHSSNGFMFSTKPSNDEKSSSTSGTSGFNFSAENRCFSFDNIKYPTSTATLSTAKDVEDVDDQPPKVEFTQVVEEGSLYSKKCKVFVKKNDEFVDRGVGTLYLKPVQDGGKTQLLVRADTNLGNILVNLILSIGIPIQRTGKNNVMLVCIPTPDEKKAAPLLIRVKTAEEADELLNEIKNLQK